MKNHDEVANTKTIRISCKVCAREFDLTVALDFYEAAVSAAEEDGEDVVFTGTCPECKAETADPFQQLMNKVQARINERS